MQMSEKEKPDLSIVMPCLNEENTVGICVEKAGQFMEKYNIIGEVIVVDNGSEDSSVQKALQYGAKVIEEPERGYGKAIRTGIAGSTGRVIIIGDADTTYDFEHLEELYRPVADGSFDMVIGNRFAGGMEKGAMSLSHRLGVRFLSFCGRKRYGVDVYDFHCGLRAVSKSAAEKLCFGTDGMEFATEMIAEAAKNNLRIRQVPVSLGKCAYKRKSKLRTVRDGFRHLRYILFTKKPEKYHKKETNQ